jgi:hypothetical protein
MSVLAIVRPDSWNLPLFLHVLGAMVMVGGLLLAATGFAGASRPGAGGSLRLGLRSLLFAAWPGYIVMRGAAQWIADKEGLDDLDDPPSWIDIGFTVADLGVLLLIVASILAAVAARRARSAGDAGGGGTAVRVALGLTSLLIVAYLVAVWAMTTKPA